MASGQPFSTREQAHITRYAYKRSWGHLAKDLAELYPDDNGGYRCSDSISRWYRNQERRKTERERGNKVMILIEKGTFDLVKTLGYRKEDIDGILYMHLLEIVDHAGVLLAESR